MLALRLQDAGFNYRYIAGRGRDGAVTKRWIPVGMPRLSPDFARCVFFLYGRDKKGRIKSAPEGTGVLIGVKERIRGSNYFTHTYAVTCAHIAPQGASIIRLNNREGGSRFIDLDPDIDWLTPQNGADIAAADISEHFHVGDDARYLSPDWFADKKFIETTELGIGEDGFMLGLFSQQPGKERNMVAAKFGNVALMADDTAPIGVDGRPPRPSHLFDIRSRGGFSGSPVFVYRTPDGDLRTIDDGVRRRTTKAPQIVVSDPRGTVRGVMGTEADWLYEYDTENNIFLRLLGIHIGQYPETVKARKLPKARPSSEADDIIRDGDRFVIEGGVTVVVPAWEILDLLNREEFVKRRAEREDQGDDEAPIPETTAEEPAPPAKIKGDDRHKERFTALLDGAVGKPKRDD